MSDNNSCNQDGNDVDVCYEIKHEPTNNLLRRQFETFPYIIESLLANNGKKAGHWAW